jgi:phosphopantetheinyl transferase (holo-ACP synthase)
MPPGRFFPAILGSRRQQFSSLSSEVTSLEQFSDAARQQAFFHCWTRKEAFIKAKGLGLSIALDQFDVTMAADEQAALLRTSWDEGEAARWLLQEIEVEPDYVAAVAIEAEDWKLSRWCFDEAGWAGVKLDYLKGCADAVNQWPNEVSRFRRAHSLCPSWR